MAGKVSRCHAKMASRRQDVNTLSQICGDTLFPCSV